MRRHAFFAALPLAALALSVLSAAPVAAAPAQPAAAAVGQSDQGFQALSQRFIAAAMHLSPVEATALGVHDYDAELPGVTAQARAQRSAEWSALLTELVAIDPARLSRDHQVDYAMLKNELEYRLFAGDALQEWAWNPQVYNDIAGGALYTLAARDFAPWDVRLKAATARMEALPALLKESRNQLVPARVPLIYAQTVAKQNAGIVEIAETMLAPHADALTGADRTRFDAALNGLKAAVAEHQDWLDKVLVPQAKGDFRLGAARYDQKMKFALLSDITRPELKQRAETAFAATRAGGVMAWKA